MGYLISLLAIILGLAVTVTSIIGLIILLATSVDKLFQKHILVSFLVAVSVACVFSLDSTRPHLNHELFFLINFLINFAFISIPLWIWIIFFRRNRVTPEHPRPEQKFESPQKQPLLIRNPSIGFLNLFDDDANANANAIAKYDYRELVSEFSPASSWGIKEKTVPVCNVLFLYGDFSLSGTVSGRSLRSIIHLSKAQIVVIASEISSGDEFHGEFIAYLDSMRDCGAAIVLTLDRKSNEAFVTFFRKIFSYMRKGLTMLEAWEVLSTPDQGGTLNAPTTIALLDVRRITFNVK